MDRSSTIFKRKNSEELDVSKSKTLESPFIKYSITAVSCLMICCVAFVFLMFQTDTIVSVNIDSVNRDTFEPKTTVSTVVSNVATDQNTEIPGVTNTVMDGFYQYDDGVYNRLINAGIPKMTDSIAKFIAGLYIHASDIGNIAIAGIGGNICHEGEPGLMQFNQPYLYEWNGPGTPTVVSTGSNPIYVRNEFNIAIVETREPLGGVGSMQFTYIGYRSVLANYYRKYLPAGGELSDDDLRAAEMDYVITEIIPDRLGVKDCDTPSAAADWWLVNYEQNGSTHSSDRCSSAELIYNAITGGAP